MSVKLESEGFKIPSGGRAYGRRDKYGIHEAADLARQNPDRVVTIDLSEAPSTVPYNLSTEIRNGTRKGFIKGEFNVVVRGSTLYLQKAQNDDTDDDKE